MSSPDTALFDSGASLDSAFPSLEVPESFKYRAESLSDQINSMQLYSDGDLDFFCQTGLMSPDDIDSSAKISALSQACQEADLCSVTSLLEQGVDPNCRGEGQSAPVHYLCGVPRPSPWRVSIAERLKQYGADLNALDGYGRTPLWLACHNYLTDLVLFLIDSGCDVNIPDYNRVTPYSVACRLASEGWYFWNTDSMNEEDSASVQEEFPPVIICKELLRKGANPKQATLLPAAVLFSTIDLVSEFIALGMDVNVMDENRRLPLGCACSTTHVQTNMVKLLLEKGADVNEERVFCKSKPIISAFVHNSVEKIRLLLSYGATIDCEKMAELASLCLSKWFLENPEVINADSKELLSWKLLVKAGFHPKMRGPSMKLKHLQLCSSYSQVSPWIDDLLFPLPSLKEACRKTIRAQLPKSIDEHVQRLPIPNSLKGFLTFEEFFC